MDNNKLLLEKVTLKYSVIVAEGKKDSQQVNMEYKTNKIKASLNNVKNIITDFKKDSNISQVKNIVICCDKCEKNVKININKHIDNLKEYLRNLGWIHEPHTNNDYCESCFTTD